MTRLHTEWRRLFQPSPDSPDGALLTPEGHTRTLVLEATGPAAWSRLAPVWQVVQTELALPAPGIAVNGRDGCQLWFSLAQPVSPAQGADFLRALTTRYLGDVAPARLRCFPDRSGPGSVPAAVPGQQAASGPWSAFVTPDLAPLFDDEPWLDLAPGDDAQADLLARLASTPVTDIERALHHLMPPAATTPAPAPEATPAAGPPPAQPAEHAVSGPRGGYTDPRDFLRAVMNDPTVPLPLRIEAARALLAAPDGDLGT
jgi:hypothetical protein